jgi:hypothetical protein
VHQRAQLAVADLELLDVAPADGIGRGITATPLDRRQLAPEPGRVPLEKVQAHALPEGHGRDQEAAGAVGQESGPLLEEEEQPVVVESRRGFDVGLAGFPASDVQQDLRLGGGELLGGDVVDGH